MAASVDRPAAAAPTETLGGDPEDDNDWRFEDDLPGIDSGEGAASLDLTGSSPPPPFLPSQDAGEDSFADLGDPETWDLLSGDTPTPSPVSESPVPEVASTVAPPASATAPVPGKRDSEAPAALPEAAVSIPAVFEPPVPVTAPISPAPVVRLAPASRASGWAAAAGLSALVAWASLTAPTSTPVVLAPVAGFEVTEARARVLDNAAAGPVLVVSGRLRNPGPAPHVLGASLRVQLLDAAGVPLAGGSTLAGPSLSERRIREESPEQLRAAQEAGAAEFARRPVAAGGELSFDAVFGPPPRAAASAALGARDLAPGREG